MLFGNVCQWLFGSSFPIVNSLQHFYPKTIRREKGAAKTVGPNLQFAVFVLKTFELEKEKASYIQNNNRIIKMIRNYIQDSNDLAAQYGQEISAIDKQIHRLMEQKRAIERKVSKNARHKNRLIDKLPNGR